jgi:peptidoglycan/xylan/chitin deacetylase (PgdA/CDA1 family)
MPSLTIPTRAPRIASKLRIASMMCATGLDRAGLWLQKAAFGHYIRAVNYHDVPPALANAFAAQIAFFREHFEIVGATGLAELLSGRWVHDRPGLILTFDDGLRSHADVVAPVLDRHGVAGWFMVPGGFVDAPAAEQMLYAAAHRITHSSHAYDDARIAMTWADVRRLRQRHEICCHTWTHCRLGASLAPNEIIREIPQAKARLEAAVGGPVDAFAWVGGEEAAYSHAAARAIDDARFRFSFMTNNRGIRPGADPLQLQRTNIEAHDADVIVRFQLSGALDALYGPKRRRVNRLTRVAGDRLVV